MQKLTKQQFEEMNAPKPTKKQLANNASSVCKRVYAWQEKNGIYAFDAEMLLSDVDVTLNEAEYSLEALVKDKHHKAQFINDDKTPENAGTCGRYVLTQVADGLWNIKYNAPKRRKKKANA